MKHKFFIFMVRDTPNGIPNLHAVYVKETGKWLEFSDYIEAKGWIKDQRASGDIEMYQLQKIYVP
jgi:hypothetical protein